MTERANEPETLWYPESDHIGEGMLQRLIALEEEVARLKAKLKGG